ncbi:MAG: hypothetical protein ACN4G0_02975 [Polyangiales bacterium]
MKLGIIAFFSIFCLLTSQAKAHPLLDRAIASYEEADFETALRGFDAAARNADLIVGELLQLFEMRALVYHAMGNSNAMMKDLRRLAAVDPKYTLGRLAPPPVRKAYEDMLESNGGTLGVELVIEEKVIGGTPFVVARVAQAPKGLVDHVILRCRIPPTERVVSRTAHGARAKMELPGSAQHDGCEATAETRRGTVLFTASIAGTRPMIPQQRVFELPKYEAAQAPVDEPKAKKKKWPWIVAAAAVVVAGGVTAGVILSQKSNQNQAPAGGVMVSW